VASSIERTKLKKAAVAVLTGVYSSWHGCALKKEERGIPSGTLCDLCSEEIKWRVAQLLDLAETPQ
jgi:hypothetical protein